MLYNLIKFINFIFAKGKVYVKAIERVIYKCYAYSMLKLRKI
jgi:hypothetical protein